MRKVFALMLWLPGVAFAQEPTAEDKPDIESQRNEIRADLVSVVYYSRYNLSYERFLQNRWSVGVSAGIADSEEIDTDFDRGYRNNRPRYDVTPFVRYRFSKNPRSFYFGEAFVSANSGDFKETVRLIDTDGSAYFVNQKSEYFDIGAGGGLGYKFYFKDQFAIELLVSVGMNFLDTDKSPDVISRTGLSIGYRF